MYAPLPRIICQARVPSVRKADMVSHRVSAVLNELYKLVQAVCVCSAGMTVSARFAPCRFHSLHRTWMLLIMGARLSLRCVGVFQLLGKFIY